MKIVLISCVKTKRDIPCKASDMYISTWFKYAYKYALAQNPDRIFILSAKYGLLKADEVIEPYEQLLSKRVTENKKWAKQVIDRLNEYSNLQKDKFVILAGEVYRKNIIQHIQDCTIPLQGLAQGEQVQFLIKHTRGQWHE